MLVHFVCHWMPCCFCCFCFNASFRPVCRRKVFSDNQYPWSFALRKMSEPAESWSRERCVASYVYLSTHKTKATDVQWQELGENIPSGERTFFRPPPASNSGSFRQGFSMFFPCKELSFTPLFSHLVLDLGCPLFGNFFRLMGSLLLPVKKVELHRALPCHLHRAQKPSCISRPRQQALALAFHRS
jgi:hypothetical protein